MEGGGEEGRQQRRSDLSGLPEERCREVDHAAARVGEEEAAAAGAKVRSVTGKSAPETSSEERKARQ